MMTSSPTQTSGGKPFCMEPQNSSACGAGFFLNEHSMKFEPCPDGKFVVPDDILSICHPGSGKSQQLSVVCYDEMVSFGVYG